VKCAVMGEMLGTVRRPRGSAPRIRAASSPFVLPVLRLGRLLSVWAAGCPSGPDLFSVWDSSTFQLCRIRSLYGERLLSEWVLSAIRMRIICSQTACCVLYVCAASVPRLCFSWASSVRRPLLVREPSSPRLASVWPASARPLCHVFATSSKRLRGFCAWGVGEALFGCKGGVYWAYSLRQPVDNYPRWCDGDAALGKMSDRSRVSVVGRWK
jgi:hypothetical protein